MASTRPADLTPLIEESIDIDAPPEKVWALVSDLAAMSRWSPQVAKTVVLGQPKVGTRALNLNRRGPLFWPTTMKITRYETNRALAFRVSENKAVWSYELAATDGGTRVVERREMADGTTGLSHTLIKRVFGGQTSFAAELKAGMAQTLTALKKDAER